MAPIPKCTGQAGVTSRGTRGNGVLIVEMFKWAALRTLFQPAMHWIDRFCVYNLKYFPQIFSADSRRSARAVLGQFPLVSPTFPLFLFYETTNEQSETFPSLSAYDRLTWLTID